MQPDGSGGDGFTFALARGSTGADIMFSQQPSQVGFLHGRVALLADAGVTFAQFVWP